MGICACAHVCVCVRACVGVCVCGYVCVMLCNRVIKDILVPKEKRFVKTVCTVILQYVLYREREENRQLS